MAKKVALPILEFDELVEVFQYKNARALRRAIRLKLFPIKTFLLAGRTVAHISAVDQFFDKMKDEALAADWDQ